MAKPPLAGLVKTRLIRSIGAQRAADVHAAMLDCVLTRAAAVFPPARGHRLVLSFALDLVDPDDKASSMGLGVQPGPDWTVVRQGRGDLGQRLDHAWLEQGGGPTVFLGSDSPDVPLPALTEIERALSMSDVAIGPTEDGGYWTLGANRRDPRILSGIDWGTSKVYHQSRAATQRAALDLTELPRWFDIDEPSDFELLRRRLTVTHEPVLRRLAARLDQICKDLLP